MNKLENKIAQKLDLQFAAMGFASPGVDTLRAGADVSLRTLYKYYPSREAMIVGALEHRHQAYVDWISGGPKTGADHVLHILFRLGDWQSNIACNGCLFLNALAAYPESTPIREAVEHHKEQVRLAFEVRIRMVAPSADATDLSEALLTIHEGQTEMAMVRGADVALTAAVRLARALLHYEGIE